MKLIVQKFGGTSVGSIERIRSVANIVSHAVQNGHKVIAVVSAMAGETDRLNDLAHQIVGNPTKPELDVLLATGEQVSMSLLSMALNTKGWRCRSLTGSQAGIRTDGDYNQARIQSVDEERLLGLLDHHDVLVVAGFQGDTEDGWISTLGRGGSDLTAVAIAAATKAQECQIYTDVKGVYSSDPRLVPKARCLNEIPFEAMLELASVGAKVLQTRAVYFAGKYQVPLKVLSSFESAPGTKITYENSQMESAQVSGIAFNQNESKISILGLSDKPGIVATLLEPLHKAGVSVDMLIQNSCDDGSTTLTISAPAQAVDKNDSLIRELASKVGASDVMIDSDVCKLSVVGIGLRHDPEVAVTMFSSLAEEGINVLAISNSETRISILIKQKYLELAARTLHSAFGLDAVN